MKQMKWKITLAIVLLLVALAFIVACGRKTDVQPEQSRRLSETDTDKTDVQPEESRQLSGTSADFSGFVKVSDTSYMMKVSNATETISMESLVKVDSHSTWTLTLDPYANQPIASKTVALTVGDNTYYVMVTGENGQTQLYTLKIRRRAMYEITLDTNGGSVLNSISVEEDEIADIPTPERAGYTFAGWNFDFSAPITQNVHAVASWIAEDDWKSIFTVRNGMITGLTEYGETYSILEIPEKIDGKTITAIGDYAFYGWSGLATVIVPDSVMRIGYSAFKDCSGLKSITIPFVGATKDGTENTHFGYIFGAYSYENNSGYVPTSLKTVVITGGTSIGSSAFSDCSGLTSITIPDSVTSIGSSAFSDCSSLTGVYITDLAKWCGISFDNPVANPLPYAHNLYLNGTLITDLVIPDSVTSIGDSAFSGCSGLTSITIPGSVTSIGSEAFSGCSGLTSITIPDSVTSIGKCAFSGCSGLTSITIPDSVTSIGYYAFSGCSGLTSITIPDSVTSIGYSAFYGCSSLTSITIPDSVTSIGYSAFYGCSSLTSITIPFVGATKDGTSHTHFGYIFGVSSSYNNSNYVPSSLKTVVITGGTSIGSGAFSGCSGLTSITIPDSVTSIDYYAFDGCSGLTSITVETGNAVYHSAGNCLIETESKTLILGCQNSVIPTDGSVTSIDNSAFGGCSGLTSITIPDGVTSIGWYSFAGCSGLTSIDFKGTMAQWKGIWKGSSWDTNTGSYKIYCTDGTISK